MHLLCPTRVCSLASPIQRTWIVLLLNEWASQRNGINRACCQKNGILEVTSQMVKFVRLGSRIA